MVGSQSRGVGGGGGGGPGGVNGVGICDEPIFLLLRQTHIFNCVVVLYVDWRGHAIK